MKDSNNTTNNSVFGFYDLNKIEENTGLQIRSKVNLINKQFLRDLENSKLTCKEKVNSYSYSGLGGIDNWYPGVPASITDNFKLDFTTNLLDDIVKIDSLKFPTEVLVERDNYHAVSDWCIFNPGWEYRRKETVYFLDMFDYNHPDEVYGVEEETRVYSRKALLEKESNTDNLVFAGKFYIENRALMKTHPNYNDWRVYFNYVISSEEFYKFLWDNFFKRGIIGYRFDW